MRRSVILAAALIGGLVASNSMAAFTVTATRTALTGTNSAFERITLYALAGAGTTDILAADLTVTSAVANGLKFSITAADPDNGIDAAVVTTAATPQTATRTRVNSVLFSTFAPGYPSPDPTGPVGVATYTPGLTSWAVVGLDGRTVADVGVKADSGQNGGLGGVVLDAVVPVGTTVTFAGSLADDTAGSAKTNFNLVSSAGTTNTPPVVVSPAPQAVVFGSTVSSGKTFTVGVQVTDLNAADILTLAPGTLPAGVSGVTITPSGGGTSPQTFTVTGTVAYSTNGTTVLIPVIASDGQGGTGNGVISLVVTPEPASLAALAGAAGLGLIRRRK